MIFLLNKKIRYCRTLLSDTIIRHYWFLIMLQKFAIKYRIIPSKHFNVVSTLSLGWYDVATWDNVKLTLKQHSVCQRLNLKRRNVVYFNVVMNNDRQRRSNIVIFKIEIYNVEQRRNNVVNKTMYKKTCLRLKLKKKKFLLKVLTTIPWSSSLYFPF